MPESNTPLIIEPEQLQSLRQKEHILLIDLSQAATYVQYHIPGAVFLDYSWIVRIEQPRMGLLPHKEQLAHVLGALGITPDTHIVTYDDEGGGRACRLLWTLDAVGHKKHSLLNGGLQAWTNTGFEISSKITYPVSTEDYPVNIIDTPVASRQYIFDNLSNNAVALLDCRSEAEFNGKKVFAKRGGHIPGAVNIEWTQTMDKNNDLRLKDKAELKNMLTAVGITPDKTVITYCQTHHRSAHTYIVLKSLGYKHVKGYAGSWSDWGNEPNTPIEN
ncbi:MAG: sulfurtransferase [Gammaproteobacteria bacterium]|nr:sulfurtransferase [Gammaproteobacteria bacterium]